MSDVKTDYGYYRCNKCSVLIRVISMSRLSGSDSYNPSYIPCCPHCKGEISGISMETFYKGENKFSGVFYRRFTGVGVKKEKIEVLLSWKKEVNDVIP